MCTSHERSINRSSVLITIVVPVRREGTHVQARVSVGMLRELRWRRHRGGARGPSEEEVSNPSRFRASTPPLTKRRKLPPLSSKIVVSIPMDDPALHQGRMRSSPHIDGRWACHLYVPVVSEIGERLGEVLSSAFQSARAEVPTLHPIGLESGRWELHISLSRPTFLWTHQREEFKNTVRRVAASRKGWALSLTEFIKLENDDRSRVFLAVQVGAGHAQVEISLSPVPVRAQHFFTARSFDRRADPGATGNQTERVLP